MFADGAKRKRLVGHVRKTFSVNMSGKHEADRSDINMSLKKDNLIDFSSDTDEKVDNSETDACVSIER